MSRETDQMNMQLVVGGTIFITFVIAMAVIGVFVAMAAVAGFIFFQWQHIYRYEGKEPLKWLAGITAVVGFVCVIAGLQSFAVAQALMGRNSNAWIAPALMGLLWIAGIALPTAAYWVYRLIKPISPHRVTIIEAVHQYYREGKITRVNRNSLLAEYHAMTDDDLETSLIVRPRANAPASAAFDVPEQE